MEGKNGEAEGERVEGKKGEAEGEREKTEELGVVVEVGSVVENPAVEEDEEDEEEEMVVTELKDSWLERRKTYMATAYWVDMVRKYLARTTGDPKIVKDANTKSIYACMGHLNGVLVRNSRGSS